MKVLQSAYQCCPGQGSELGNGWNWAVALADYGHEVTVLTQPEYRETILSTGRSDIDFHYIDAPVTPLQSVKFTRGYDSYRHWQDAAYEHAKSLSQQFDVIHHTTWGSLHLGSRLYQLPVPLVYGPIGGGQTAPSNYWRYFGQAWPAEMLRSAATGSLLQFNAWSRQTLKNAAITLVTNSETEAAARRLGARDVRYSLAEGLLPEWLGTPRQRPSGIPVILWVGRMMPRKAPTLAVKAFAELLKTVPARLVMAGDGPLHRQVRETVERLGVGKDVDLLGRVPWTEIARLYDSATVFLFCSLRDSSGAQFLEAMGRGLPAVTLDLHGMSDVEVGIAAEKVPLTQSPDDLPALVAASLRTVLTGDDWEARSAAGIEWAAGNTYPAKVEAATRIYEEVARS